MNKEKIDQSVLGLVLDYVARRTQISAVDRFCEQYTNKCDTLEEICKFYHDNNKNIGVKNNAKQCIDNIDRNFVRLNRSKKSSCKKNEVSNKSLSDFSNICDGYGDLHDELNLNIVDSSIAKITKYILDTKIEVQYINIQFSHFTSLEKLRKALKEIDGNYHTGRFTEYEDAIIRKNWINLCASCDLNQPEILMKQIHKL